MTNKDRFYNGLFFVPAHISTCYLYHICITECHSHNTHLSSQITANLDLLIVNLIFTTNQTRETGCPAT